MTARPRGKGGPEGPLQALGDVWLRSNRGQLGSSRPGHISEMLTTTPSYSISGAMNTGDVQRIRHTKRIEPAVDNCDRSAPRNGVGLTSLGTHHLLAISDSAATTLVVTTAFDGATRHWPTAA